MKTARLLDLGIASYREVWDLQHRVHADVAGGTAPDTWIVVQHPPVITLGRNAKGQQNVLLSREALAARGIDLVEIERGGDVTYHGPGQLVIYPIRKLERFREVVPLVRTLEGAVIDAISTYGIVGERWSEHAGVWVGKDQICAIGLAVQKMTSLHGIALNVSTALDYDTLINPCGMTDRGITSISAQVGHTVTVAQAKAPVLATLAKAFDTTFEVSPILRQAQDDKMMAVNA